MSISNQRLQWVDALRGLAIVLMVVFHFCYDLTYYRLVSFDFYNDPFWLHFRTLILGLFLFVAGVSIWLANHKKLKWFLISQRLLLISASALLISVVTWFQFGERYVYFGVLHFIAVSSLLALLFIRLYWPTLIMAVLFLFLGQVELDWFDSSRWHHVIGLMTYKPSTEDYVPLLPWFGVVLLGVFFIQFIDRHGIHISLKPSIFLKAFSVIGKYSLIIYLLHQPVLFSLLWGYTTYG